MAADNPYSKAFENPNQSREGQSDAKTYEDLGTAAEDRQAKEARKKRRDSIAAARAAKEAKKKKKDEQLNIEFDDQSFLWDNMDLFQNEDQKSRLKLGKDLEKQSALYGAGNPDRETRASDFAALVNQTTPHLYKNFLQIKDDEPITTKNKLFAMGINSLNAASTAQLSSIVPYFKLFKVLPQKPNAGGQKNRERIQFPFNKFTTMESILQSRENRGTDVGLKSVRWEDTGANPGNVGLAFKGNFTLHFQSFEGIFKTRMVDGHEIRFADIMVLESLTGRSAAKNPKSEASDKADTTNVNCNTVTEIHMECGWTLPPDGVKGDPKLTEELQKLRRTYIITPIDQDIKVTNNGAVDMDVTFCAAIEGRTFGSTSDLLNIDVTNLKLSVGNSITSLQDRIKKYREEIRSERSGNLKKKKGENKTKTKNVNKAYKEKIKTLKENISNAKSQMRSIRYQRMLSVLRSGTENRIFYVDLNKEEMEIYKNILVNAAESYSESKESTAEEKEENIKNLQAARLDFQRKFAGSPGRSSLSQIPTLGTSSEKEEETQKKQQLVDGMYRMHYVYLGDIIESAMTILYDNPDVIDGKTTAKGNVCPQIKTDVRVLMGAFSYLDTATGNVETMQLADIPVSLTYFNSWWYDTVIKRKLNNYPLRSFLRDLCGKLLNNVMSPKRYGGMPGKRLRCSVQAVFTKKSHPLEVEWENKKAGPKSRIDIQKVFKNIGKGKANQYSQWLYVYVAGGQTENAKLNGKIDEDLTRNIPHYFIGADTGVVKDISFTKTKIPGKRESLIYRSKMDGNNQDNLLFSDRYDAKVRLIGNPIFKPGMLLYVDPRAMGLGVTDVAPQQYMADLGIGGYYRVVRVNSSLDSSKFETELSTISEYSSREIAKNKKAKKE